MKTITGNGDRLVNSLKGTWRLIRLALRRDRVKLSVAVVSIGMMIPMFIAGISEVFESDEEMVRGIAFLAANPAMRLFGLPTGGEFGNLLMLRTFVFIAIVVALISTFTVIRHTRQNEELGRSELIGASAVGRYSGLTAALLVAFGANIAIAALAYGGLLTGDVPSDGALLMAAGIGGVGLAFSGIAVVCAQLAQTSRGANGLAAAAIGLAFLFSGIGSVLGRLQPSGLAVEAAWPIWLSPFGWAQQVQPFAAQNTSVLLIFVTFFFLCAGLAALLASKRDVGMGIFDARRGRETASSSLLNLAGFTWRMQRGVFCGWLVGVSVLSVIYGIVAGDAEDLLSQAEGIAELFLSATGAEEIMLAFFGSIMGVLGIFVLAYAVQSILKLRSEESRALEFLLSTQLGRTKWISFQVLFVAISSTFILAVTGLITGMTAELMLTDITGIIWPVIAGALVQFPAIMLLVGLIVVMFAVVPRLTNMLAWTTVAISIFIGPFIGSMLNLPEQLLNISPLTHTPVVPPLENIEVMPLVVLSVIAALLLTAGIAAFRRRDLTLA